MSRVIGFSLKLEGTQSTLADIKKVEAALGGIGKQIKEVKNIDASAFKPLADGQAQFKKALETTNKIIDAQIKALNGLGSKSGADTSLIDSLKRQITTLKEDISKLKKELHDIKSPTIEVPSGTGLEKLGGEAQNVVQKLKDIAPAIEQLSQGASASFLNKLADIEIRLKKIKDGIKNEKSSGTGSTENLSALLTEEKALLLSKKELTKQLNEEAKAFSQVKNEADPTSLVGLREELKRLKAQYIILGEAQREAAEGQQLFNKIVGTNTKISNIEQSIGDFRRNVGNYQNAVQSIIPTLERLQEAGQLSQSGLLKTFNAESKQRAAALREEVNRLAAAFHKMTQEERESSAGVKVFGQLSAKAKELEGIMNTSRSSVGGLQRTFIGLGDLITGGIISGGAIAAAGAAFNKVKQAINISAELSDIESDVRKTTGLTVEDVKKLETELKKIDTRTTTANLLKISAIAGQLGVEGSKGIEDFTKAINVVLVALGDDLGGDVDSISNDLAKLSNILFGSTTNGSELATNIQHIGNSLNVLASTSAATGDKIVDFASRIGRSLKPLGVTAEQILALSATFDELNILPEQGATAINNVIKDIGANINNFASVLEINKVELEKAFNTNPLNAFKLVLEKLNKLSGGNNAVLLEYLAKLKQTGEGVSSVILQLSSNTGLYDRNLQNATSSLKDISSITNEYEIKNNNLAGSLDKLKKKFQDVASSEGIVLLFTKISDFAGKLTDVLGPAIQRIALLLNSAFSGVSVKELNEVGASIERYFGKDVTDKFSKGQYLNEGFTLANRIVEIKKNNAALESEIDRANKIIVQANANIGQSTNDLFIKAQEKVIENQKKIIQEKQSKIVNPNQYANNFIQDVLNPEELAAVIEKQKAEKKLTETELEEARKRLDGKTKESEKKKKIHDDYLKSLEDLNKRLQELSIEAIDNEFDKRIEKIELSTKSEVREWEKRGVLTVDIQKKFYDLANKEIDKINEERQKALQEAKNELIKLQGEVQNIILEGSKNVTESNIDTSSFKFAQINREIEIKYNVDNTSLKEQLAKGEISEKEFKKRSAQNEKDKLNDQLKAAQDYSNEVNALYQAQYLAQLKILEAKKVQADKDAEIEASLKRQKLVEDSLAGKVDDKTATKELLVIENQLTAKKNKNLQDYNIAVTNANQELVTNQQQTSDKITGITQQQTDAQIKKAEDAAERKKALIKEVINLAVDTARTIADAVFEIENNQIQDTHDRRIENLEREKEARLKLVKGNAAEEERINREFEAKKKTVDRAAAREKQDVAIKQAIINGALAGISAIANTSLPFPLSLLALIPVAAAVAAQIAVIRSQSFAEGGFTKRVGHGYTGASQAPPDSSGKRPVGTATIHENEYFAPAEQVSDNKPLFDELEKDRMSRKRGFGKTFKADSLNNLALKAVEAAEKSKLGKVVKFSPPVLYQYTHFLKNDSPKNMRIHPEDVALIASEIAGQTSHAVNQGISDGYHKAVTKLQRHQERLNIARERTQL